MTTARPALTTAELADFTQFYAEEILAGSYAWNFDAENRWHQRLYRDDRVDIWLISWLPTQGTQLHDHGGSSGAFTVLDGDLQEAQVSGASSSGSTTLHERTRTAGSTVVFGPNYIHDVYNNGSAPAVSVHAYSPPLTLMNFYDLEDGTLTKVASLDTDDPEQPYEPEAVVVPQFATVDDLLSDARSRLQRISPFAAAQRVSAGARLVDIRPEWQRAREGEIPGALIVERNHLEWRLHPSSPDRVEDAKPGQQWIVVCSEGYTSSLAADALNSLGIPSTDVVGGFRAWSDAGLPIAATVTPVEQRVHVHNASDSTLDAAADTTDRRTVRV